MKIICPVAALDCPYYDARYDTCKMMEMEDCHPKYECDDYAAYAYDFDDSVDESNYNPFTGQDEYECDNEDW